MNSLKRKGRYLVAAIALSIAFALSIQLGDRAGQFDLGYYSSVAAQEGGDEDYQLSSLRIFNRALLQIKENYVEPERIDPGPMLLAALDAVQNEIPEFVVRYDHDVEGTPDQLEVQVVDAERAFQLNAMESLWEMSLRLKEIFIFVEQHLPDDPERSAQDIEYAAINGMVTLLDPHSGLLTPSHYEEMQTQTGGEFGGLGIVISIEDGELTVISPIDGTPAADKGIRSQDKIVRIGEESTVNMNLNEAVSRLRGKPGTEIDIWIERAGWSEPRQFTLERDIIEIESVESEPLADKVGYVRINNFQANTHADLRSHLNDLRERMGGMDGLILDMRDNPGGLLDQSIRVSNLFLEEGDIVSTVGVGNTLRDTESARRAGTEPDYPMVVLVNEGSASASEIVAGALQKNDRAVVLGDITFGKGTVQILYEFPDSSALKLTVAQYLTPGGVSIQNMGILPDLQTIPVNVEEGEVSLFRSELIRRERDMDRALQNPSTRPDDEGPLSLIRYLDPESFDPERARRSRGEFREDFEIELAARLLREVGGESGRTTMLEKVQSTLESVFDEELGRIQSELTALDVDWGEGQGPGDPAYEFEVTSNRDGDQVTAGESVELTAKLTNRSEEPLHRAKALTRSDNPQLRYREFIFGRIDPGESKEWTVEVEIPKDSRNRHDRVYFVVSDDEREYSEDHYFDLIVEGQPRPHYAFTYEVIGDDTDGVLRVGDEVTLRLHLENQGEVPGDDATVYLKNMTGSEIYLDRGRGVVSNLEPGATEHVDFEFQVNEWPEGGMVKFELDVYDTGFRDFVQREFELPMSEEDAAVESVSGLARVTSEATTLRVSASDESDPVAAAGSGATLPVIARAGDWLKVQLDGRSGWVSQSDADFEEGASGELAGVERIMRFQKPRVDMRPAAMLTSDRAIDLEAYVEDEWNLQDYYVIVHHRRSPRDVDTRKLAYQRVDDTSARLSTSVPLFEGMNQISLVTRNDAGIQTTETIYVYRE